MIAFPHSSAPFRSVSRQGFSFWGLLVEKRSGGIVVVRGRSPKRSRVKGKLSDCTGTLAVGAAGQTLGYGPSFLSR